VTALHAVRGLVPLAVGFALLPSLGLVGVGVGVALGELLGPVVIGGAYLREHLRALGNPVAPRWQPIALGTALTTGFLTLQWVRGPHFGAVYALALVGVLGSVFWGWVGLSTEVRVRVLRLVRRQSA
jgi:hypothetical protein